MHKSLNTFGLTGVALALAMTPVMAGAQEQPMQDTAPPAEEAPAPAAPSAAPEAAPTPAPAPAATEEQLAQVDTWPADRQTSYKAWPVDTQNYFWSLETERQEIFWRLRDPDKVTLSRMETAQRESTWAQLEAKAAAERKS